MNTNTTITRLEVKSCSAGDLWSKGGIPGTKWVRGARVWVRQYDANGKRIAQELVGFIDTRCTGPRSRAARILATAEQRAAELGQAA